MQCLDENMYSRAHVSKLYLLYNTENIFEYSEGFWKNYFSFDTFFNIFSRNTKIGYFGQF